MILTLILAVLCAASIVGAVLLAVGEYQQRTQPVSAGDGPLRHNHHRATVLIGGRPWSGPTSA